MGTVAILLGLGGGLVLAAILIFVVNRSYFGWTIRPSLPAATLIEQAASILVATIVASAYPALRAARTPATELSRDDV
jgi:putative ABC transport system permease protein